MPMKMYYLFLEPMQLESLKKMVEHYFRNDAVGSGFDRQVREIVDTAQFLEELTIDWGAKQADAILSKKNEPDWSFMWAMRELESLGYHLRHIMGKAVAGKMRQDRLIDHLRNIHNALDPEDPALREGVIDAKKYIAELFQKNKISLEVEKNDKVSNSA